MKQDEASNEEDKSEDEAKEEGGDEESVHSDSSSQLHFATPLCE